ncbi:MAG TPA: FAD-dependent oxidoreductase [Bacteroidales bacterium]|nr:MAG: Thioredoxin reductase [Bacteroidetes bacterium ADurb.Bin217]HOS83754.1 FAD-dependent oxidoreductase [Bacteroidales bacterium]HPH15959.1 FAD-dependent oxidoreductase [Bacteroidales bacterium]HPM13157.1 FAD-dependent oxidoreductase [Bacteroidales bacterium]
MKEISSAEFEQVVLQGNKVVVDFYSTECPPCEALAPKFDNMAELYGEHITFVKIYRQGNRELAEQLGVKSSPTVLFFDNGKQVTDMISGGIKKSELVERLDAMLPKETVSTIKSKITKHTTYCDALIIGGGPAGLAAGLYLCQAKVNTILVDIQLPGGQVSTTHQVSNYPGFVEPQPGYMLSHHMSEQTRLCGTQYKVAVDVAHVDLHNKTVEIDAFETIQAKKIIIATGASPRPLGIPGEKEYKGRGISYCATCDAKYFNDKDVIVIGGGNSAVEEAEFITKFAKKVTMIHQFAEFTANKQAVEKILANPKVSVLFQSEPRAFTKQGDTMTVEYENLQTKERQTISADGIFVFIGMQPNTSLFGADLQTDNWNYIVADEDMQTNIPGVYAIGDVRSKKYRQITTAVADGTIAAIHISKELM